MPQLAILEHNTNTDRAVQGDRHMKEQYNEKNSASFCLYYSIDTTSMLTDIVLMHVTICIVHVPMYVYLEIS